MQTARQILIAFLSILLAGCGSFLDLKRDLNTYSAMVNEASGTLVSSSCADCAFVVVVLDKGGKTLSYKIFEHPGYFKILLNTSAAKLFAFHDRNGNFQFDADEPYAERALPDDIHAGNPARNLMLNVASHDTAPLANQYPHSNLFELRNKLIAGIDIQLGTMTDLNQPKFDQEVADKGMWQPVQFMKDGLSGIYILDKYSPEKTPVLFIHGINGTPRDFATLVQRIDRNKFQPWFFYYPSGLEIPTIGNGLVVMLNHLHVQYQFSKLHIVAHSMGGLVGRSLLNTCVQEN